MTMVIIDRFEGDFVVVELPDKTTTAVPIKMFPGEAREGDVIKIEIDRTETKKRKAVIGKLMSEVWEK